MKQYDLGIKDLRFGSFAISPIMHSIYLFDAYANVEILSTYSYTTSTISQSTIE